MEGNEEIESKKVQGEPAPSANRSPVAGCIQEARREEEQGGGVPCSVALTRNCITLLRWPRSRHRKDQKGGAKHSENGKVLYTERVGGRPWEKWRKIIGVSGALLALVIVVAAGFSVGEFLAGGGSDHATSNPTKQPDEHDDRFPSAPTPPPPITPSPSLRPTLPSTERLFPTLPPFLRDTVGPMFAPPLPIQPPLTSPSLEPLSGTPFQAQSPSFDPTFAAWPSDPSTLDPTLEAIFIPSRTPPSVSPTFGPTQTSLRPTNPPFLRIMQTPSVSPASGPTRAQVLPSRAPSSPTWFRPALAPMEHANATRPYGESTQSPTMTQSLRPTSRAPATMMELQKQNASLSPTSGTSQIQLLSTQSPSLTRSLGPILTQSPIQAPSPTPNSEQTLVPSLALSVHPTLRASEVPTQPQDPSLTPTSVPMLTLSPILHRTPLPTLGGTTLFPSLAWSLRPTLRATVEPTQAQRGSLSPTMIPRLTLSPVQPPSPLPNLKPTLFPSFARSLRPTSRATAEPTQAQHLSLTPTLVTTVMPSRIRPPTRPPNLEQTWVPSLARTDLPMLIASVKPTQVQHPSITPMSVPMHPTPPPNFDPALRATGVPTQARHPSPSPTMVPMPTLSPIQPPSTLPNLEPTLFPSFAPTLRPTLRATAKPTQAQHLSLTPTLATTLTPSPVLPPTALPNLEPTLFPGLARSHLPTFMGSTAKPAQTQHPSLTPTLVSNLTLSPIQQPISLPNWEPTLFPSLAKSLLPTSSLMIPTQSLSLRPSAGPWQFAPSWPRSHRPSFPAVSPNLPLHSTRGPTQFPTLSPSTHPTQGPTLSPPTYLPSMTPTAQATRNQTPMPSIVPTTDFATYLMDLLGRRMPWVTFGDESSSQALHWISLDESTVSLRNDENRLVHRFALATLYFATGGHTTWIENDWLTADWECGIRTVACSPDDVVEKVHLWEHGLSGTIPKQIGLLTTLTWLSLGKNDISGSIPSEIGLMTSLTFLQISRNNLTESIPTELANLTNLRDVRLNHNQLSGSVPTSLCSTLIRASINCGELECGCCSGWEDGTGFYPC